MRWINNVPVDGQDNRTGNKRAHWNDRAFTAVVALSVLGALVQSAETRCYHHHSGAYNHATGESWVHRPEKNGHHSREVTICGQGTLSYSHHHRGMGLHHAGMRD
jgi:hypothetical protein